MGVTITITDNYYFHTLLKIKCLLPLILYSKIHFYWRWNGRNNLVHVHTWKSRKPPVICKPWVNPLWIRLESRWDSQSHTATRGRQVRSVVAPVAVKRQKIWELFTSGESQFCQIMLLTGSIKTRIIFREWLWSSHFFYGYIFCGCGPVFKATANMCCQDRMSPNESRRNTARIVFFVYFVIWSLQD